MIASRSSFWKIALVVPLIGLAILWATTHVRAGQGAEWDVPVEGYDPRDLLRGHYVEYQYAWPGISDELRNEYYGDDRAFCIMGSAPRIDRVTIINRDADPDRCAAVVRANFWAEEGMDGMTQDRIYIPQTQGRDYDRKLADQKNQAIVRVRIRDDGHMTPLRMTFRPRPAGEAAQ